MLYVADITEYYIKKDTSHFLCFRELVVVVDTNMWQFGKQISYAGL
jgi:hypothetical protein